MKNEQFYKITLTDCGIPNFCSGSKDYYGTQEKIEGMIIAIKNNKSIGNDVDGLYAALTEFKSGNKNCEHPVEYGRSRFLTSVSLIDKSEYFEKNYKWKHVNIWHYPYYMRTKAATFRQIVIKDGNDYIRAIKPEFEFLKYALDEIFRRSDKVGVMLWGFPEMIRYNGATKTTSSRLYVLGDLIWKTATNEAIRIIKRLNGQIILIKGNHDRFLHNAAAKKALAGIKDYDDISVMLEDGTVRRCILSHYFIPFYNGHRYNAIHLHGHSHFTAEATEEFIIAKTLNENGYNLQIYNVGCMYWNYAPLTLDEILKTKEQRIDKE